MSARASTHIGLWMRVAVAAALVLVSVLTAREAQAQLMVNLNPTRSVADHKPSTYINYISKEDCLGKDVFTFSYTATTVANVQLEVWLADDDSLDCSLAADRSASAPIHCTRVASDPMPKTTSGTLPIASSVIAKAVNTVDANCVDSNSATDPRPLKLYFLLMTTSGGNIDLNTNGFLFTAVRLAASHWSDG
jgi:hypothetical protein